MPTSNPLAQLMTIDQSPMTNLTFRIFTNGGIVSPDDLRKLTQIAKTCGCEYITPGSRQELYLQAEEEFLQAAKKALTESGLPYANMPDKLENIVTSFAAIDIFPTTAWLLGDTYLDILYSFDYQPTLKINIVDPLQNLVPLFTGELNFIASTYPRFWYLYLHLPRFGKKQIWPLLIDGDDIGNLSKLIEEIYTQEETGNSNDLFTAVNKRFTGRTRHFEHELHLPFHEFPLYGGLHKAGSTHWLGIYRRNHRFSINFMEALHKQCVQSKIGKLCITPHKMLLIKDIREEDRLQWEKMLGMHSINIQHSALELNWQLPDLDQEAMELKNALVRELVEKEARTAGVSFAIQTKPLDIATSVIIRQETGNMDYAFSIYHTADFTVNNAHWQSFARNVSRQHLIPTLLQLCQAYYTQLGTSALLAETEESPIIMPTHELYQCPHCLTIYDPLYGDSSCSIAAGVSFKDLPETYACNICETSKESFMLVESQEIL